MIQDGFHRQKKIFRAAPGVSQRRGEGETGDPNAFGRGPWWQQGRPAVPLVRDIGERREWHRFQVCAEPSAKAEGPGETPELSLRWPSPVSVSTSGVFRFLFALSITKFRFLFA
jgi:hypothetical protein